MCPDSAVYRRAICEVTYVIMTNKLIKIHSSIIYHTITPFLCSILAFYVFECKVDT